MFDLLTIFATTNSMSLIALFILLVPIIIHLINPNKAKLIWIAHIQLIQIKSRKRAFQIKWLEKLILVFRLLMLVSVSLVLAKPSYLADVINIDEEHHYVSSDWLDKASVDELMKLDGLVKSGDKLFFLEQTSRNQYRSLKQLKSMIEIGDLEIDIHLTSQSEYIAELEYRKSPPKITHIYLTNRQNSYNNKVFSSSSQNLFSQSLYKFHLHHLIEVSNKSKVNIKIIYDENNKIQADLLLITLNILSADSAIIFDIKKNNLGTHLLKRERSDLVFKVGDAIQKNANHLSDTNTWIEVIPQSKGIVFKSKNNVNVYWSYSEPLKLLEILSEFINRIEKISAHNRISEELILNNYFQKKSIVEIADKEYEPKNVLYLKSMNSYLIFLFCLFFLIERGLVLSRNSQND